MVRILCFLLLPFLSISQEIHFDEIDSFFEKKQYKQAENTLINFLEKHPNSTEAMALLGDAYSHQKQWDRAIEIYEKVVKIEPNNANYQYKYGLVMGMKGLDNRLKAIPLIGDVKTAFHKAAKLDKTHIDARWALCKIYMEFPAIFGGSMKKSLEYAQELETLSKVDGYLAKGYIYDYDDDFNQSEHYYKKAVQIGGSITCYKKLAGLYAKYNKLEKAIETLEVAQKKLQENDLYYQLGKIAAVHHIQLEKGKRNLSTYITNYSYKDDVSSAWAHYRLAQIYCYQNNKTSAIKHINLALKMFPNQTEFKAKKQDVLDL